MNKEQILSMPHLKIADEKQFLHIETQKGYFITSFDEKSQDIKEYSSSTIMYMPILDSYPEYKIITSAKNDEFIKKNQEAYEKEYSDKINKLK